MITVSIYNDASGEAHVWLGGAPAQVRRFCEVHSVSVDDLAAGDQAEVQGSDEAVTVGVTGPVKHLTLY